MHRADRLLRQDDQEEWDEGEVFRELDEAIRQGATDRGEELRSQAEALRANILDNTNGR